MAAKDLYHDHVRNALVKDGWTITHDPLSLPWDETHVEIDLAAERLLVAEKGARKIAVEVKSFLGRSQIRDLEDALGQFVLYRFVLSESQPDRELYLAIRKDVYRSLLATPKGEALRAAEKIRLIVFDQLHSGGSAMDRLSQYRQIIEQTLSGQANRPYANPEVRSRAVFDRQSDNYLVISEGWDNGYRVHHCLIHLELINGKIWIQRDGLEEGVALDLERAGIPKNDIVLGFQPADVRPHTEYAAA